jgi:hypothetical protein
MAGGGLNTAWFTTVARLRALAGSRARRAHGRCRQTFTINTGTGVLVDFTGGSPGQTPSVTITH